MSLNQDNTIHWWKYNSSIEFLAWHAHKTLGLIHSTRKREGGREENKRERKSERDRERERITIYILELLHIAKSNVLRHKYAYCL